MDIQSGERSAPVTGERHEPASTIDRVAHDMQGIFAVAETPAQGPLPRSRAIVPIVARPSRRPGRLSTLSRKVALPGALIIATLLASAIVAQHGLSAPVETSRADVPTSRILRVKQDIETVTPVRAATGIAPPVRLAAEDDPERTPAAALSSRVHTAAFHPRFQVVRRSEQARRYTARTDHGTNCDRPGRAGYAWCMRPQLIDADRTLRHAYDNAARAGLNRQTLVSYRQQWLRLLSRANAEPEYVAAGYRRIAQQLDDARLDARADD